MIAKCRFPQAPRRDVPYQRHMTKALRLHYAPDNASLCVRLALEEIGLPYETALVDRKAKAQNSPEYLRLNPQGLIPVLETPDGAVFETAAILMWLANTPQGAALMPPTNTPEHAQTLSWLFSLSNGLHPTLRMLFYADKFAEPQEQASMTAMAQARLADHLTKINAVLETTSLFAPATALTCYLMPMLRWPALYPRDDCAWYDLARWPALHALARTIETRPAAQRCADSEGLGPTPFSAPHYPTPPEGSAL